MYSATFEIKDYGTERTLTIKRDDLTIAQLDPFILGMPVSKPARKKKLQAATSAAVRADMQKRGELTHEIKYQLSYSANFA